MKRKTAAPLIATLFIANLGYTETLLIGDESVEAIYWKSASESSQPVPLSGQFNFEALRVEVLNLHSSVFVPSGDPHSIWFVDYEENDVEMVDSFSENQFVQSMGRTMNEPGFLCLIMTEGQGTRSGKVHKYVYNSIQQTWSSTLLGDTDPGLDGVLYSNEAILDLGQDRVALLFDPGSNLTVSWSDLSQQSPSYFDTEIVGRADPYLSYGIDDTFFVYTRSGQSDPTDGIVFFERTTGQEVTITDEDYLSSDLFVRGANGYLIAKDSPQLLLSLEQGDLDLHEAPYETGTEQSLFDYDVDQTSSSPLLEFGQALTAYTNNGDSVAFHNFDQSELYFLNSLTKELELRHLYQWGDGAPFGNILDLANHPSLGLLGLVKRADQRIDLVQVDFICGDRITLSDNFEGRALEFLSVSDSGTTFLYESEVDESSSLLTHVYKIDPTQFTSFEEESPFGTASFARYPLSVTAVNDNLVALLYPVFEGAEIQFVGTLSTLFSGEPGTNLSLNGPKARHIASSGGDVYLYGVFPQRLYSLNPSTSQFEEISLSDSENFPASMNYPSDFIVSNGYGYIASGSSADVVRIDLSNGSWTTIMNDRPTDIHLDLLGYTPYRTMQLTITPLDLENLEIPVAWQLH